MASYYIVYNGQTIGPMTAEQVMGYNPSSDMQVSKDGGAWAPLYTFPELMNLYNARGNSQGVGSQRILCGILAIIVGTLGVQYFVINKVKAGIITIILSIVTCGAWGIITLIQGILMLCMSDQEFEQKYVTTTKTFPLF